MSTYTTTNEIHNEIVCNFYDMQHLGYDKEFQGNWYAEVEGYRIVGIHWKGAHDQWSPWHDGAKVIDIEEFFDGDVDYSHGDDDNEEISMDWCADNCLIRVKEVIYKRKVNSRMSRKARKGYK